MYSLQIGPSRMHSLPRRHRGCTHSPEGHRECTHSPKGPADVLTPQRGPRMHSLHFGPFLMYSVQMYSLRSSCAFRQCTHFMIFSSRCVLISRSEYTDGLKWVHDVYSLQIPNVSSVLTSDYFPPWCTHSSIFFIIYKEEKANAKCTHFRSQIYQVYSFQISYFPSVLTWSLHCLILQ